MNVKELIELLKTMNPESIVVVYDHEGENPCLIDSGNWGQKIEDWMEHEQGYTQLFLT
jgi:hypothetical protein